MSCPGRSFPLLCSLACGQTEVRSSASLSPLARVPSIESSHLEQQYHAQLSRSRQVVDHMASKRVRNHSWLSQTQALRCPACRMQHSACRAPSVIARTAQLQGLTIAATRRQQQAASVSLRRGRARFASVSRLSSSDNLRLLKQSRDMQSHSAGGMDGFQIGTILSRARTTQPHGPSFLKRRNRRRPFSLCGWKRMGKP
ncbi:hypothetical protein VTK73DRAFT_5690 [Phialemonium thermophilum]|uniref:Uncharacterized protein n=1 Tax=Phialemonium thermophilum TaxID=223376 RepID=A0ABR3WMF2_9PEZI